MSSKNLHNNFGKYDKLEIHISSSSSSCASCCIVFAIGVHQSYYKLEELVYCYETSKFALSFVWIYFRLKKLEICDAHSSYSERCNLARVYTVPSFQTRLGCKMLCRYGRRRLPPTRLQPADSVKGWVSEVFHFRQTRQHQGNIYPNSPKT